MLHTATPSGTRKKKYLRESYHKKVEKFKKSDHEKMTLAPVSYIPGVEEGFLNVVYTKVKKKVGNGQIFIIKKDGVPVSFTWEVLRENYKNIQQAVAEGIYHPGALTAEVLCAMATYRNTVRVDRIYENGIISNKYLEKDALLTFSQKRVQMLQRLELLINSGYDLAKVQSELADYLKEMTAYQAVIGLDCANLEKYDAQIQTKFKKYLQDDIDVIDELNKSLNDQSVIPFLRAFGKDSMQVRLELMMINITKQAQGINRNLTYASPGHLPQAIFNGDFNSMCENVMHVIDRYEPDLHNPVLPEHQGDFSNSPHDKLYLEFSVADKNALAVICNIEKRDIIEKKDGTFIFKHTTSNQSVVLNTTRLTNWASIWSSFERESHILSRIGNFFKRVAFFALNLVTGTLLTPIDIVMGIVGGLLGYEFSFVEYCKQYPEKVLPDSDYLELSRLMKVPNRPLAFYLALLVGQTTRSIILDIVRGIALTAKRISRIPRLIIYDYHVGGWGDKQQTTEVILVEFEAEIDTIKADKRASEVQSPDLPKNENEEERHFALPPYHLSPGEWRDAGSMVPKGLVGFGNTILTTHAKDPVLGLIYNIFYFAGLSAIYIPNHVRLPDFYKEFSGMIGTHMAHGVVGQGISNAVMQAQMSVLLFEVLHRGPNSLLGQLVNKIEKNLVDIVVLLLLARLTGGAIRSLPVIGSVIDEELGTSESVGLVTYASKLAILFYETCVEGEIKEISEEKRQQFIERGNDIQREYEDYKTSPDYSVADQKTDNDLLQQLKPYQFLMKLTVNSKLLPELPTLTKRKLLQEAQHLFQDTPEVIDAVENMLYPDHPYSIASRTMHIVTGYISNVSRVLISPFTGNIKQPLRDLKKNIFKDLARVVRIIYGAFEVAGLMLYAGIYTIFRALSDALFNGFFARLEGVARENEHALSECNIKAASSISTTYHKLCAWFSTPGKEISKAVTYGDPGVVIEKSFAPLFTKYQQQKQPAPAPNCDTSTNNKL